MAGLGPGRVRDGRGTDDGLRRRGRGRPRNRGCNGHEGDRRERPVVACGTDSRRYRLAVVGVSLDFSVLPGRTAGYLFAFAFALLLGGGQEELGWRGFALPRLQRAHGPMAASLVIGVVWAVWHLPLFAMEGTSQSQVPFLAYAPAVVAMSVIFTWLYNESAGCILPVMLLHAGINSTGTLIPVSVDSVSEALHSQLAMAELAVLVGIALVVLLAVGWSLGIEERTGVGPTAESRSVPGDSGPGHSGN
ncbi:hypothetical protein BRD15_11820 [Halobacteriales archaeon SW_6_65_15]|nr:MAG: hypothetical protein BRD15_11820 [Halobacteriales archaeon SW_6_65_15]